MPVLVSNRLANQLQRITEDMAYTDKGLYYPPADPNTNLDSFGQPAPITDGIPFDCSFTDTYQNRSAIEKWAPFADIEEILGETRMSTPIPAKGGRILITHRFEELYPGRMMEVIAVQDRGPMGFLCAMRAVAI